MIIKCRTSSETRRCTKFVVCCDSVVSAAIKYGPRNTVVIADSQALFSCFTNSSEELCWARNKDETLLCSPAVGCRPRYSTTSSAGTNLWKHSFIVNSCNATDSGHYRCEKCKDTSHRKFADLVVFGRSMSAILVLCYNIFFASCIFVIISLN